MDKKDYLSTQEVAKLLGISRVAVFKKIKIGTIRAKKTGRNYIIARHDIPDIVAGTLTESQKHVIESAVKKTVKEYGETLRLLGKE